MHIVYNYHILLIKQIIIQIKTTTGPKHKITVVTRQGLISLQELA